MPSSTPSSSSQRVVTFAQSDTVRPLTPPPPTSEAVSEPSRSSTISPAAVPSSAFTSTPSTSGPPPNSEGNISVQNLSGVETSFNTLTALQEALDGDNPDSLVLNPSLSTSNPVEWNMLIDPQPQLSKVWDHPMTKNEFPDSISEIQIDCDTLLWPIVIKIKQDVSYRAPQIGDIFESIYTSLWKPVARADFEAQAPDRQLRIREAHRDRCAILSLSPTAEPLKRIDFLESKTIFLGLSPGDSDKEWCLHVG